MTGFIEFLETLRFQVLALVVGVLLVIVSSFKVDDISELKYVPLATPVYSVFLVGVALILVSVVGTAATAYADWTSRLGGGQTKILSSNNSVTVKIGENILAVKLGRLEACIDDPSKSLIVLPANEYFNDKCINDIRSALGAFVQSKFPGRSSELKSVIATKLRQLPSQKIAVDGKEMNAYGLGVAVFLDRPLSDSYRILVVAATTERPGEGLKCNLSVLFPIIREANRTAREHRIPQIFTPLIGSGHGCLRPSQALLVQLLAWCEILFSNPGQRTQVNIIVFQPSDTGKAELTTKQISQLVRVAVAVFDVGSGG